VKVNPWTKDLPAALVVFLVALPLCLGIALASNAPLFSGVIAGVVGGIVVGALSGSHVSVSGPAAGLTVIVVGALEALGTFEAFLLAVFLAGIIQVVLGFIRAGVIAYYFPSSVIKGMLAAIGLILILKQIPHAVGWDRDYLGDESFEQPDNENTFSELLNAWEYLNPGALVIALVAIALMVAMELPAAKRTKLKLIPGALLAVLVGTLLNEAMGWTSLGWKATGEHLVTLPVVSQASEWLGYFATPDFSLWQSQQIWVFALTIAVVASIESLLSVEATDKLDPLKRVTPTNRELKAQGVGNVISGLIGGLPVTAVIVRSSANIEAGALTKRSAIVHGLLLALLVVAIPSLLNKIPLSALAAVLLMVGYKLTKPALIRSMYQKGWDQFLPFLITIVAILFTDLLKGIAIGMVVGLFFVIRTNFRKSITFVHHRNHYLIRLTRDVSFLNKARLIQDLVQVPDGAEVLIDTTRVQFIDRDIRETLDDFIQGAPGRGINITLQGYQNLTQ
jgi:MFS superfamily sulfate permease-like transporter